MKDSTTIGQHAEKEAWQFLATQGFELLEKNFSCRAGEIDLIVRDTETLVFVEVRFRQNSSYGSGAETVTSAKRRRIIRTAEYYLLGNPDTANLDFRFDVISIGSSVDWIENAFTLNDR
jgi:putative endonuclease